MSTSFTLVLVIHIIICLSLVVLVVIQRGKGADMGAAFGAGASGTVFGSQGSANFLTRATSFLAAGFFVTSLLMAFLAVGLSKPSSTLEDSVTNSVVPTEVPALSTDQAGEAPSNNSVPALSTEPAGTTSNTTGN